MIHVIDNYPFIGVGADYALGQNEYVRSHLQRQRALRPAAWRVRWRPKACTATSA